MAFFIDHSTMLELELMMIFRVFHHSEMIPLSQVSESFLFKVHTHNAIAGPLEEICIQIAVIYVSSSSTKPLFQTVTSDGI